MSEDKNQKQQPNHNLDNQDKRREKETVDQYANRVNRPTFYGLDLQDGRGKIFRDKMTDYIGKDDSNNDIYMVKSEFVDKEQEWELYEKEDNDYYDDYEID